MIGDQIFKGLYSSVRELKKNNNADAAEFNKFTFIIFTFKGSVKHLCTRAIWLGNCIKHMNQDFTKLYLTL